MVFIIYRENKQLSNFVVGFWELQRFGFISIYTTFGVTLQKLSNGVITHDLGGQLTSPKREIIRPWNFAFKHLTLHPMCGHLCYLVGNYEFNINIFDFVQK